VHSVSGDTSAGEVSLLVNEESFKVTQNKRAPLITKPEKNGLYRNVILFNI